MDHRRTPLLCCCSLLALVGCAHHSTAPAPEPTPRLAPGMRGLAEAPGGAASRVEAWEPNFLYPTLPPRALALEHDHGDQSPLQRAQHAEALRRDMRALGPGRAALHVMFRAYQATYSRVDGSRCTFVPTCSRFGAEAVASQGLWGVGLTFGRLIRNHVRGQGFYQQIEGTLTYRDPVDNYLFWAQDPGDHPFGRFPDDPAKAWLLHLRRAQTLEHPAP